MTLIETAEDAKTFTPKNPDNLAFVTQTTLSIDDTAEIVAMLKERFPNISGPHKEDICYATTNRQLAVKKVAPVVDALIVVGAPNSSNSQRLREVAEREGCPISVLAQRASDIDWKRFEGIKSLGITAGASAPEVIVEEIMGAFAERYPAACGDGLGRGRERVLPAAAFGAARRSLRDPSKQPVERHSMAVYTDVTAEELAEFLKGYDIGELLSYKGIAEGVENSNFLMHTSKGAFILTLYEKRVAEDDLPYFLSLMAHLAEHGVSCPQPAKNRSGAVYSSSPGGPRRSSISSKACGRGGRTRRIAPASAKRWQKCISPAATFRCIATIRCRFGLAAAVRAGRRPRRQRSGGPARFHRARARLSGSALAGRSAGKA